MKVFVNGNELVSFEGELPISRIKEVLVTKGVQGLENASVQVSSDGQNVYFNKKADTLG